MLKKLFGKPVLINSIISVYTWGQGHRYCTTTISEIVTDVNVRIAVLIRSKL
jgi:hypothetical protein